MECKTDPRVWELWLGMKNRNFPYLGTLAKTVFLKTVVDWPLVLCLGAVRSRFYSENNSGIFDGKSDGTFHEQLKSSRGFIIETPVSGWYRSKGEEATVLALYRQFKKFEKAWDETNEVAPIPVVPEVPPEDGKDKPDPLEQEKPDPVPPASKKWIDGIAEFILNPPWWFIFALRLLPLPPKVKEIIKKIFG